MRGDIGRWTDWGRTAAVGGLLATAAVIVAGRVRANPPVPSGPPGLLQQLSDETQRVYGQARAGIVRVQLPTPIWLNQQNRQQQEWLRRLDEQARLGHASSPAEDQERAALLARGFRPGGLLPTGEFGGEPPAPPASQPVAPKEKPDKADKLDGGFRVSTRTPADATQVLTAVGLLVDGDGHIVVPIYLDRDVIGPAELPAWAGDGRVTTARFVGSDRLAGLTVLQLADHNGSPAALDHGRPDDGTLALAIAFDGGGRLVFWSGLRQETGLVFLPDGAFAGFGFDAQHFFAANQAKAIVDQLIARGEVVRPKLGVKIDEVPADDLVRQRVAALGTRAAVRVRAVAVGSPADAVGVKPDDLILSIDGRPVGDRRTLGAVMAGCNGQTPIRILRGATTVDVVVTLATAAPAGR